MDVVQNSYFEFYFDKLLTVAVNCPYLDRYNFDPVYTDQDLFISFGWIGYIWVIDFYSHNPKIDVKKVAKKYARPEFVCQGGYRIEVLNLPDDLKCCIGGC